MLRILKFITEFGMAAAKKKFGTGAVKEAITTTNAKVSKIKGNKPKPSKPKAGSFVEDMFGRKRTGKTPTSADSKAYRDGVKAGKKQADEKLDPSLKNKNIVPRNISDRKSDVAKQLREAKEAGMSPKAISRLEGRLRNLKDMGKDRLDTTTIRGKFSGGGLATHTDYRKTGLFK
tara:strand:- start:218 stop:742 length:525 start_codon:yes stop_codon:yes gene_type:complete